MTFKVLSYNIRLGGEERLALIQSVIRRQQPDVVALVEANDRVNAETLARDLRMEIAFGEANSPHHIAWLSHLPIMRMQNHRLPALSRTLLEIEVFPGGEPFHLFATHLAPLWEAPGNLRQAEAEAVLAVLASRAPTRHVLVGDFNALHPDDGVGCPPSREATELLPARTAPRHVIDLFCNAGYVDCCRAMHPRKTGYTYSSDSPWSRIGFILASPLLATCLCGCDVVTSEEAQRASDHLPIWAEFSSLASFDGSPST